MHPLVNLTGGLGSGKSRPARRPAVAAVVDLADGFLGSRPGKGNGDGEVLGTEHGLRTELGLGLGLGTEDISNWDGRLGRLWRLAAQPGGLRGPRRRGGVPRNSGHHTATPSRSACSRRDPARLTGE